MALPTDILDEFLRTGKWSSTADDNIFGELFSSSFLKDICARWKANPNDEANIAAIGLFPLGLAVAGWGISDPAGLPDDPDNRNWGGAKSTATGKHLMSYAKGGIGIPHADSSFLEKIIEYLKKNHRKLAPKFDQFYALKGTNFDKLYANGGHCTSPTSTIMKDLDGNPFGHKKWGNAGANYCATYNTKATTKADWQVFRHWLRAALRQRDVQNYIISYWIDRYWIPSYEKTLAAGGTIPEAIINCRIRNSGSSKANKLVGQSIEEQLAAYRKTRRNGVMLRAANLWEAFAADKSIKAASTKSKSTASRSSSSRSASTGSSVASVSAAAMKKGSKAASTAPPTRTGSVTGDGLRIRTGPSTRYQLTGLKLYKRDTVTILETKDGWHRITAAGDKKGWVSGAYVIVN